MANLSYLTIGVPASGRLVFRNIHDQPVTPSITTGKTGTGGIDPGEGLKRRTIVKPTGLLGPKKKAKKESVEPVVSRETPRTDDVALVITPEIKPVFAPIATMSQAEIHAEIGRLLHEKLRTDDDEFIFLLLMMAAE